MTRCDSSVEAHITELQGQLAWVHNREDRTHCGLSCGEQVDVEHSLVADIQVVQSIDDNLVVECNAVEGPLSKNSEVQLGVDSALQSDRVRCLGGKSANEGGEFRVGIRVDIERRRWEGSGQSGAADRGRGPIRFNGSEVLLTVLLMIYVWNVSVGVFARTR